MTGHATGDGAATRRGVGAPRQRGGMPGGGEPKRRTPGRAGARRQEQPVVGGGEATYEYGTSLKEPASIWKCVDELRSNSKPGTWTGSNVSWNCWSSWIELA